jgi:hypothetical protein
MLQWGRATHTGLQRGNDGWPRRRRFHGPVTVSSPGRRRVHTVPHGRITPRFPAPWRADKVPGGYGVRDATGQAPAYLYGRETEADARQAKVLTNDEARRIAINTARLPELLGKAAGDCELVTNAEGSRDEITGQTLLLRFSNYLIGD